MSEWSAWLVCFTWCIFVGVYPAADGLGTIIVGAGLVGQVDVGVAEVDHLDGRFTTWCRTTLCWLRRGEGYVEWTDLREVAETNQSRAERLGCVRANVHVLESVVQGWDLAGDDAGADIAILRLRDMTNECFDMVLLYFMTYTADITDASQYIFQEAFPKVGHELETTQENLALEQRVSNMT